VLFPATTDNNYFRNAGVPVYGIIPAVLGEELMKAIHNYNERIPVESLVKGTEVYIRFLEKLLSGNN
jgi:acetylornithine deacetylase/succinyl-diaminopimelate desuccinylase-like protein